MAHEEMLGKRGQRRAAAARIEATDVHADA
jgi:hypothetical protein